MTELLARPRVPSTLRLVPLYLGSRTVSLGLVAEEAPLVSPTLGATRLLRFEMEA
jgi:hypothetical protein